MVDALDIGLGRALDHDHRQAEAARGKAALVVIGNTGAGKSSFINVRDQPASACASFLPP